VAHRLGSVVVQETAPITTTHLTVEIMVAVAVAAKVQQEPAELLAVPA
jgi:hypothetical protein